MLGFLPQPVRLELMAMSRLQLFLRLLGKHHDVAHRTGIEDRIGVDVPDLVGAAWRAFSGKVAVGLAAQAHDLEQLQDRIVLSPGEDLTQREPLGRNALEFEHPRKLAVAVAEDELVVPKLEQPDPDRQRLEDVRQ